MDSPRVILVAAAPVEERLRAAVPELNGNLARWPGNVTELCAGESFDDLLTSAPDIVAFGPELPIDTALALSAELDRLHPEVVVLLLTEPSPLLWERAARAGVREMVSSTADDEHLRLAVQRTFTTVASRGAQRRPIVPRTEDQPAVIVVRSPKGGSGKTMVASNLAVMLAEQHPGEVVLIDLDIQFGDVSSALGVDPQYTIADATANADLTPTSLKASLSRHSSELYALCAPFRPKDSVDITGDDVTAVLALLRSAFRYVIVDTAAGTSEHAIAALDSATDVVLVCSMDVSSVRALAKDVASPPAADGPAQHLVLNRSDSRVALDVRDIEATLGCRVDVQLSSSRLVPLHMNCGVPVAIAEPAAPITKQLKGLVERMVPVAVETRGRNKRWRRR